MMSFQVLKKLACLALVTALLAGCSSDENEKEYSLSTIGFTSDTTAILFYKCSETYGDGENIGHAGCGVGMKLVDVRFNKVYWESQIDVGKMYDAAQWNDSTMLLSHYFGQEKEEYLWTIGNSKPQEVDFNRRVGGNHYWRPWKNNSILGYYSMYAGNTYIIIDLNTNTVNDWTRTGEYEWTQNCNDIYWGKNGGICLTDNQWYFHSHIKVSEEQYAKGAMFKYDDDGNLAQEPSFWVERKWKYEDGIGAVEFTSPSGNVTKYLDY
jgi:hypothetical protein